MHRTVLARLLLSANNRPEVVHGVTITEAVWKDKEKDVVSSSLNEGLNRKTDSASIAVKTDEVVKGDKAFEAPAELIGVTIPPNSG